MIFKPETLGDLKGLDKNIDAVKEFIRSFQDKEIGYKKACLLSGHQGTGKTSLVHCLANEYGFPLVEINGSEIRTKDALIEALGTAISTFPMEYSKDHVTKHRIILIDEADGLFIKKDKKGDGGYDSEFDKSGMGIIPEILKRSLHPIFLTANDGRRLKSIKNLLVEVKFYKHKPKTVANILRNYTNNEDHILKIAECCDGDIRAALNMLDSCVTKIYTEESIHFVVDSLLNGKPIDGYFDIENKVLLNWLEENIQYRSMGISFLQNYENLCNASRMLWKSSDMTRLLLVENTQLLSMFHINEWIKTMSPSYNEKRRVYETRHIVVKALADRLPLHTHKRFESDMLPILQRLAKDEKWLKDVYQQYLYDNNDDGNPKAEVENMIALLLNVTKEDIAVKGFFDSVKDKKVIRKQEQQETQQNKVIMKPMANMAVM